MSDSKRPHITAQTHCACGKVSISIDGPVLSMFLCSCTDCQKVTGTGHSAAAIFSAGSIKATGPLKSFARPAASGATMTRHFCADCGTPIYAQSSRRMDGYLMPAGLFEDQSWFVPNQVIFHRAHQHWDILPDMPKHQTYRGE